MCNRTQNFLSYVATAQFSLISLSLYSQLLTAATIPLSTAIKQQPPPFRSHMGLESWVIGLLCLAYSLNIFSPIYFVTNYSISSFYGIPLCICTTLPHFIDHLWTRRFFLFLDLLQQAQECRHLFPLAMHSKATASILGLLL